jgi:hypothetical protein
VRAARSAGLQTSKPKKMKITRNWVHTANARRQAMAGRSDILGELDASP